MVKLEEEKHRTSQQQIEKLPLPTTVYIPLSQHVGQICTPLVKAGEYVYTGQKIASAQAQVFSPIHSSASGKVTAIQEWPHPALGRCKTIIIENDGLDRPQEPVGLSSFGAARSQEEAQKLTPAQIRDIAFEAGIVGMGGAGFPAHIKLNPPRPVNTLIINGVECEPYLTADYRLMLEKVEEIILGVELAAKCLGVENTYIAIEDNKPEAIAGFRVQGSGFRVAVLKSQYPQGSEKQLIKNILGQEVPSGKLPFDVGVMVFNVATILALYEAVYKAKPLYERVVTITGSCLSVSKNLLVRLGTPIKALVDFCGGLTDEPEKIIIGGPMMGVAQYSMEVPVIKTTTGVILLNKEEAKSQKEEFCIRCGACVRECPAGLMPCLINLAAGKKLWLEAKKYGALDCIECGLCSYVCPANRMLVQSIKMAKLEVK